MILFRRQFTTLDFKSADERPLPEEPLLELLLFPLVVVEPESEGEGVAEEGQVVVCDTSIVVPPWYLQVCVVGVLGARVGGVGCGTICAQTPE